MQKEIFIVDDDPSMQELLQLILHREGYRTRVAADAAWLNEPNFPMPDLFLLDRFLTNADGLEVCRRLKTNPSTSHLPVIMISASADIAKLAIAAGANDYVEKPFNIVHISNVVQANLIPR